MTSPDTDRLGAVGEQRPTDGAQRVVVVLGFHRSGTSMVTRMLDLLGVDLGDERELLAAEERDNARGYWEPRWMIELNEELLELVASGTFEPFSPEPGWELSEQLDPLRERAREQLSAHFAQSGVWGWKDPRTSLTLPFWRTVIDAPMSFVICVRSPADAVASALKRGLVDMHRWSYAERWLDYTGAALANTLPDERLLVFYEDVLHDPAGETQRLAEFLAVESPSPERLRQSTASVDPELRHHMTDAFDVAVDPGLPIETRALYLLLRARRDSLTASRSGFRTAHALERIAGELAPVRHAALAVEHAHLLAKQEAARAAELVRVREQELERLQAEIAERVEDIERLRETIGERDEQLAARDAAMVASRSAIAERDAEIATYLGSRSWRLTRPMRLLAGRVRDRRD